MARAFVFPGQGSQTVGMGRTLAEAFPAAREVFQEVDEALGQKLSRIIWEGPEEDLTRTENAQPALMAVSTAVARAVAAEGKLKLADHAAFAAGHSLGEYSALVATGALELAEAAQLLRLRGQAMQKAVPQGEGAMAALLGMDLEPALELAEAAAEGEVCQVANDNSPGQVVLSGAKAAVERAIALAPGRGAKRAILLPVSAPFHCALMQPAAEAMAEALARAKIEAPTLPIVCNVTAEAVEDPETIRHLLVEQVTGMVRWRESMLWLRGQGVETLVELGAGKVLTNLARRIDPALKGLAVGEPADVEAFLKTIA
ncbi:ACP S-malonyltransferase [Neomegalonema sp.]|uniref:ACP S-malonyltransferase n=1 Tax=Neomegalonema sp. TaxID=2039713 RepID=UPI002613969A|nr:ACP S-malonyltransferase [Neomegalonema sp.]MDD2870289.1 ACP S-malonyltransferase [Neomegalonema sp.]